MTVCEIVCLYFLACIDGVHCLCELLVSVLLVCDDCMDCLCADCGDGGVWLVMCGAWCVGPEPNMLRQ